LQPTIHHDNNLLNDYFNNLTWQADNDYNVFENISDYKWIEKLGGEATFEFEPVRLGDQNKNILLFDPSREVFVELNENESNYGPSEDELTHLYNGKWKNNDYKERLNRLGRKLSGISEEDETSEYFEFFLKYFIKI
jgi:hypothetical protein